MPWYSYVLLSVYHEDMCFVDGFLVTNGRVVHNFNRPSKGHSTVNGKTTHYHGCCQNLCFKSRAGGGNQNIWLQIYVSAVYNIFLRIPVEYSGIILLIILFSFH